MLEELRLASLGVIDEAVLELGPGFTVITGETGAGKTMVVTALQLLLGARADSGLVRSGTDRARVEGRVRLGRSEALRARLAELDADVDDDSLILSRVLSAEGRSRAVIGGTAVPVGRLGEITDTLVAVHGQADQRRLLRPAHQREALDRYVGAPAVSLLERFGHCYSALRGPSEALRSWWPMCASAPVKPRCYGLGWPRSRRRSRFPARTPPCGRRRIASRTPTRCVPRRTRQSSRCRATTRAPAVTRQHGWTPSSAASSWSATTILRLPSLRTGWPNCATWPRTSDMTSPPMPPRSMPTPADWPGCRSAGPPSPPCSASTATAPMSSCTGPRRPPSGWRSSTAPTSESTRCDRRSRNCAASSRRSAPS